MIKIQTCLPVTCLEHMPISCNSALYISLQMLGFALMSSLFPQLLQSCPTGQETLALVLAALLHVKQFSVFVLD